MIDDGGGVDGGGGVGVLPKCLLTAAVISRSDWSNRSSKTRSEVSSMMDRKSDSLSSIVLIGRAVLGEGYRSVTMYIYVLCCSERAYPIMSRFLLSWF